MPEPVERIVVALDASPQSVAALKAAAELAALMQAELEGLFIEDINLLYLCGLPFGHEIGSYTAKLRRLDNAGMERQLRVLAATIQQVMERVAAQTPVRWSFQVRRGPVVQELLAAAQSAALMSMGRAGRVRRRGIGSTAQSLVSQTQRPLLILGEGSGLEYPLTVVYTGTAAAQRALELALRLVRHEPSRLRVVVWDGGDTTLDTAQVEQTAQRLIGGEPERAAQVTFVRAGRTADLLAALRALDGGTLVLPHEQAALVAQHAGPTLLVP
ncbi:MAG: universal stress protein [Caldilineaceae bacterium]|nr:universal stress protein [Caldilineaceae bacterium]